MLNERVVRRSNALRGSSAAYCESASGSFFRVLVMSASYYLAMAAPSIPFVRRCVGNWLYPPGGPAGPSVETRKGGRYKLTSFAITESVKTVTTTWEHHIDVCDASAVLSMESVLCAVELGRKNALGCGVPTPSVAFGDELVRGCRDAGVSISTTSHDSSSRKTKEE